MTSPFGLHFCPFFYRVFKNQYSSSQFAEAQSLRTRAAFHLIIQMTAGAKGMKDGYSWDEAD